MLSLLFLFFVNTLGKQNFQVAGLNGVSTAQALTYCQNAGLCTSATGCCNGHGVCKANATYSTCDCGTPTDCRSGLSTLPKYTGTTCNTVAIDSGCCKDGSDDYLFSTSGVCNHRNTSDAETGAKGRLLQRLGSANYNDSYGSCTDTLSQIFTWQNDLLTSGSVSFTRFNMMGLGFLQFAIKDIVHLDYYPISEQNITFNGTTYPKIRWQTNTGVAGTPKQFENVATATPDAGPLYDYATLVGSGPYINVAPAVSYWTNTHHMTAEFLLALKYLGLYHNYVAANVEEYFCGTHSTNTTAHSNTCTIPIAKQYELARRSTIRFWQYLLNSGPLFFGVEKNTWDLFQDVTQESYFHIFLWHDQAECPFGQWYSTLGSSMSKNRQSMEFTDGGINGITYQNLQHHAISALDFFISARNPNINTTAFAIFGSSAPCGFDPATITYPGNSSPAQILQDVVNYANTKTQRWGSKIHSTYASETALLMYRANELGLNGYKNVLSYLTDNIPTSDLATNVNVFYGIHKDTSATRKWSNTTNFLAIAANVVAVTEALLSDRTGYFGREPSDGGWTRANFHPDPSLIVQPSYEFSNCYKSGGECTVQALRAARILTGQLDSSLLPLEADSFGTGNEIYMSRGALNSFPYEYLYPVEMDTQQKPYAGLPLQSEFVNALFYRYDGAYSMAYRGSDSSTFFLPNSIMDAFPPFVAYGNNWAGNCFQETFIQSTPQHTACSRSWTPMMAGSHCVTAPFA